MKRKATTCLIEIEKLEIKKLSYLFFQFPFSYFLNFLLVPCGSLGLILSFNLSFCVEKDEIAPEVSPIDPFEIEKVVDEQKLYTKKFNTELSGWYGKDDFYKLSLKHDGLFKILDYTLHLSEESGKDFTAFKFDEATAQCNVLVGKHLLMVRGFALQKERELEKDYITYSLNPHINFKRLKINLDFHQSFLKLKEKKFNSSVGDGNISFHYGKENILNLNCHLLHQNGSNHSTFTIKNEIQFKERFYPSIGLSVDGDSMEIFPYAKISVKPTKRIEIVGSYHSGYEYPVYSELGLKDMCLIDSLSIQKIELGLSGGVEIDFLSGNSIKIEIQREKVENFIAWKFSDADSLLHPVNIPSADNYSIKCSLKNAFGTLFMSQASASMNITEDENEKVLPHFPDYEIALQTKVFLPGCLLYTTSKYEGKRFSRIGEIDPLDDYFIISAGLKRDIKFFRIHLMFENILDNRYQVIQGYFHSGFILKGGIELIF